MGKGLVLLLLAIVSEVIATSLLKATAGFTKWQPTVIVLIGYAFSFYLLSHIVKIVPVGIAYALWSGVGIVLITVVSWLLYKQKLDFPALFGIALIAIGVIVIQLFSKVQGH